MNKLDWNTETRKHRSGKYVKYTMCNMYNCFRFYWLLYSSTNHIRFFFQNFEGLSWDLALTQSNQLSAEIWRPSAKIFFETSIPYLGNCKVAKCENFSFLHSHIEKRKIVWRTYLGIFQLKQKKCSALWDWTLKEGLVALKRKWSLVNWR